MLRELTVLSARWIVDEEERLDLRTIAILDHRFVSMSRSVRRTRR